MGTLGASLVQAPVMTFVMTGDLAASRAFYAETLELPEVARDEFAVTFALANGTSLRLTPHPHHAPSGHTVLGWVVADIAASAAALAEKGVAFNVYEGFGQDAQGVWTAPGGDAKVAWFSDPDGNVLSLTQLGG